MAKFILQFNGIKLKDIPVDKETITIGRSEDNDVIIDNLAVSRHHAQLVQKEDRLILEDLNSFNGTFVNEKKVTKCKLRKGDKILIGKHILIFLGGDDAKISEPHFTEETCILDTKKHRELLAKGLEKKAEEEKKVKELKGVISYISDKGDIKELKLIKRVTVIGKGEDVDIKAGGFFVGKSALLINKRLDAFYISRGDGRSSPKLNGEKIKRQIKLRDNDFIEVGSAKMHFSIRDF
jgi:pSer/pThr/pTyr-binding forkhead associated (FHA) protein